MKTNSAVSLRELVERRLERPPPAPYWFLQPLAWCVVLGVAFYQRAVPARFKPACRFVPSCSQYMRLAVQKYGFLAGVRLGRNRLRRCVGFVPSGEDWP